MSGLRQFQFSEDETNSFRRDFSPVLSSCNLSSYTDLKDFFLEFKRVVGIYFWVMRYESSEYKIYIGKTKSLANRVLNYTSQFQPHSPNDLKLQLFQAFIVELLPGAELDLYFSKQSLAHLTEAETEANRKYRPLFFGLPAPSAEAKEQLKTAFQSYYRSAFIGRLGKC
jgi:hypothetical protein